MHGDEGVSPLIDRAYSGRMLQGLITHPDKLFEVDQVLEQNDLRVTVLAVEAGVPRELFVEFVGDENPENMVWQWFDWSTKTFKNMEVPSVGKTVEFLGPLAG